MRQWTVDAFATVPLRGNPACVVEPLETWPPASWMQALAAENNQAETAFLLETGEPGRYGLRWFTPAVEVPLCGHATLASAHVLFAELGLVTEKVAFDTLSGTLVVGAQDGGYEMDFPAHPPHRIEPPPGLAKALGAEPREVWVANFVVAILADEAAVRTACPDLAALKSVDSGATQGAGCVAVAALADPGRPYDVVSRFFAPGLGIDEDPATGALHCMLAPLYAEKLGKASVVFHQAYPGRGGDLVGERRGGRVLLRGQAQTVVEGRLRIAP